MYNTHPTFERGNYGEKCAYYNGIFMAYTHTHPFKSPFSGTTRVNWDQKDKTNQDFTEGRGSEWKWQWHQQDHMQVCTSLQTNNHASTLSLSFSQAGCSSCHTTNSVEALKAHKSIMLY